MMRHNLMTITTKHMGCPDEVVLCHTRVLNQMKHFVQNIAGISDAFIQVCSRLNIEVLARAMGGGCFLALIHGTFTHFLH